jgi:hypothetical protein
MTFQSTLMMLEGAPERALWIEPPPQFVDAHQYFVAVLMHFANGIELLNDAIHAEDENLLDAAEQQFGLGERDKERAKERSAGYRDQT